MPKNKVLRETSLPDWNDLRYFFAIAEHGSLAGAARALAVNHSTVFRRLNDLENTLDARLFERFPSGYRLTPSGERMLEHVRLVDTAVHQIMLDVAGQDLTASGKVRLTAAANIARTLLPPVLKSLLQTHPGILVEVSIGDSDYDLNRREADLALRATSRPPEHLVGRKVMNLSWWLCGSMATQHDGMLESLRGKPIVGADQSLMRLPAFQWLEDELGQFVVARANDLSTMASLIKAGIGLGLLPSDQQEKGLKRLVQIPALSGELWLLTHPDLRNTQRVRVVWEAILDSLL